MNNKITILILIPLIFISCEGLEKAKVIDNYYLIAMDYDIDSTSLKYKLESDSFIGVIPAKVVEIGYNDEYIIAKRKVSNYSKDGKGKQIKILFYIIPLKEKVHSSPDENKIGPLSKDEFTKKRKELGVSDELHFTKTFEKLK